MTTMNKKERFLAAIAGDDIDRLPISVWLHFASEHLPGEDVADLHLRFYEEYDFDYVKVMNDYRYPLPDTNALQTADDLLRFQPLSLDDPIFAEQLKCLRRLHLKLGPNVPLIETIFSPIQVVLRGAGNSAWDTILAHPKAAHHMLETVAESVIDYVVTLRDLGVTGIFFSINGANHPPAAGGLEEQHFAEFVAPYDKRVLNAANGLVRIGHIHGYDLDFDRIASYPFEALNWSHHHSKPSLEQARNITDKALIGGIDEVAVFTQTALEAAADVRMAVQEAGWRKFLVGPGCTVLPDTSRRTLHALVDAVRSLSLS